MDGKRASNRDRAARIDLAAAHRLAVRHGFSEGVCNHFTLAVPDHDDRFLVVRHGLHWDEVTATNLLTVDLDGTVVAGEGAVETSAFCIHAPIHAARADARCVLHTHMPYATTLTMLEGARLEPVHQTALRFVGEVAYDDAYNGLAFDRAEGERLAAALGDKAVLFLANHGVIVVGPTVGVAYDRLYYLERACQTLVLALATGLPLRRLAPEVVARTKAEYTADAPYEEAHFAALKRLLDRDGVDYAA